MQNEPSGEYYDWTITGKPERPWVLPYHQTLVWKIMNCYKDEVGNLKEVHFTFEQTHDVIRRFYNLSLGMPQVVYLTGWQYNGHDSKYPSWEEVNPHLKREQDATALESLKWLMNEAQEKYNCRVSLHINMMDAYPESPYWDEYVEKDIVAKDLDGNLIEGGVWGGMISYPLSYTQEWKLGLAQKRIDGLIEMLPELVDSGTIHIDAFLGARKADQKGPISPYLGFSKEEEASTQRKIYRYFRDKGIDVTSEWAFGLRDDRYVGLQPWSWHQEDKLNDLPDELYCSTKFVNCDMWLIEDPKNPPHIIEKFFGDVLAWHYSNHKQAEDCSKMIDGNDICMPALWQDDKTMIAYSEEGTTDKEWELPKNWEGTTLCSCDKITYEGLIEKTPIKVEHNKIKVSLGKKEAIKICPINS